MGCGANYEGIKIAEKKLVTHVLGNEEKFDLLEALNTSSTLENPLILLKDPRTYSNIKPLSFSSMIEERSRAFLKIQDGCNAFCSYCIVPYIRGKSRSLEPQLVSKKMAEIVSSGFNEVVLTGIHLGQWGQDLLPSSNLLELLKFLENSKTLPPKLRLTSIEPKECSEELLKFLSTKKWFCHHFHIPLQSGDDSILKAMERNYTAKDYSDVVNSVRSLFPNSAIGADVIVGFPQETEKNFENTYKLIELLPITYLHVFPYSPRPGTKASLYKNTVTKSQKKRMVSILRELGFKKKLTFMSSQVNKILEVVLEKPTQEGYWLSTSSNYLPAMVYAPKEDKGALVRARITHLDKEKMVLFGIKA